MSAINVWSTENWKADAMFKLFELFMWRHDLSWQK